MGCKGAKHNISAIPASLRMLLSLLRMTHLSLDGTVSCLRRACSALTASKPSCCRALCSSYRLALAYSASVSIRVPSLLVPLHLLRHASSSSLSRPSLVCLFRPCERQTGTRRMPGRLGRHVQLRGCQSEGLQLATTAGISTTRTDESDIEDAHCLEHQRRSSSETQLFSTTSLVDCGERSDSVIHCCQR